MTEVYFGNSEGIKGNDDPRDETDKRLEVVDNRIYFYGSITSTNMLYLNKAIRRLSNKLLSESLIRLYKSPPIYLHINSGGGDIFASFAGMDAILTCPVDVYTIVDGYCASGATFLSVVGKKRCINKNAYMLIHQLSSKLWGKYEDCKDDMKNMDLWMKKIKEIYKTYTDIPTDKIEEVLKHDLCFDAETCLKYKLVDEIL